MQTIAKLEQLLKGHHDLLERHSEEYKRHKVSLILSSATKKALEKEPMAGPVHRSLGFPTPLMRELEAELEKLGPYPVEEAMRLAREIEKQKDRPCED